MRAETQNHFQRRLHSLRAGLRQRADELIDEAERNLANEGGAAAECEFQGYTEELALADNERALYQQVEDALRRVELGTYGTCQACGREIAADRLEAIPYASTCAACAGSATAP